MNTQKPYEGFEIGPIRPPSEAGSLLLRVTRNCPWNKCTFCGLYKGQRFSIRPVNHVLKDIDAIRSYIEQIQRIIQKTGHTQSAIPELYAGLSDQEQMACYSALNWMRSGAKSVFLQDANSLLIKPDDLVTILRHLRRYFPKIERITSYARSHTIARMNTEDLAHIAEAGLNRIHIGLESGCDQVLDVVKKGVDKETHILAGQKVKRVGIELSEYYMPGLGGAEYSREHALETADAMNRIDPDFIRIRTLAIPGNVELFKDYNAGTFQKIGDVQIAEELLLFIENLNGITSILKSDHILNLLQEVEGTFPDEKEDMTAVIRKFLDMNPEEQMIYMVGRRTGKLARLDDMENPGNRQYVEQLCRQFQITPDNVESTLSEMMRQFI